MIEIFCRRHHSSGSNCCCDCEDLYQYSAERVDRCIYGVEKPVCAKCPVHCYKKEMRDRIKEVMRFAGPRMILKHPILAVLHVVEARRDIKNPKGIRR